MSDADATLASLLAECLMAVVPDAEGPFRVKRLNGGRSNLTFVVSDTAGRRWVLRRPPLGNHLETAHDIGREFRILRTLDGSGLPVPRAYGLAKDPDDAAPVMVMEYVSGIVLDSPQAVAVTSAEVRSHAGPAIAQVLAGIHRESEASAELDSVFSRRPYAERQLYRWKRQWDTSPSPSASTRGLFDSVTAQLARETPRNERRALIHGDAHLRNVLLDPTSGDVAGLIDWELSTLGDPLADLGTTLTYWQEAGDPWMPPHPETRTRGFSVRADLVDAYEAASGTPVDRDVLRFWHALGLWRLAAIMRGIHDRDAARFNDGDRQRPAVELDGEIRALLEFTSAVIARNVGY